MDGRTDEWRWRKKFVVSIPHKLPGDARVAGYGGQVSLRVAICESFNLPTIMAHRDGDQRHRLVDLIEEATVSPSTSLDLGLLQSIKATVRASDANVHTAFEALYDKLKKNHSQVSQDELFFLFIFIETSFHIQFRLACMILRLPQHFHDFLPSNGVSLGFVTKLHYRGNSVEEFAFFLHWEKIGGPISCVMYFSGSRMSRFKFLCWEREWARV